MRMYSPSGVSFFTARDTIITEKHPNGVYFESNIRCVPFIGQVSLLFMKFHGASVKRAYGVHEKGFALTRGGRLSILPAEHLAGHDFYEIMILLKTFERDTEDPMLCNLWVKNKHVLFSSFLEPKRRSDLHSTLFFGGLKWFPQETGKTTTARLHIMPNMHLLSSLYLSFTKLPMQFEKQEQPENDAFFEKSW